MTRPTCTCACHDFPKGVVKHIVPCCTFRYIRGQTVPRAMPCDFGFMCPNDAVRLICWDSNPYENDKYAYACQEHADKYEVKV